jgi:hypothetical protein
VLALLSSGFWFSSMDKKSDDTKTGAQVVESSSRQGSSAFETSSVTTENDKFSILGKNKFISLKYLLVSYAEYRV